MKLKSRKKLNKEIERLQDELANSYVTEDDYATIEKRLKELTEIEKNYDEIKQKRSSDNKKLVGDILKIGVLTVASFVTTAFVAAIESDPDNPTLFRSKAVNITNSIRNMYK